MLMKRVYISVLVILAGVIFTILMFNGPLYYQEDTRFNYAFFTESGEHEQLFGEFAGSVEAMYLGKESPAAIDETKEPGTWLHFKKSNNFTFYLKLSEGSGDYLDLQQGETYRIYGETRPGFPSDFNLVILNETTPVFFGYTGALINYASQVNTGTWPEITEVNVIPWRFLNGEYYKATNTNVTLRLDGTTVKLHQGQSKQAGSYTVHLITALDIEYTEMVLDGGMNNFSFVIARNQQ